MINFSNSLPKRYEVHFLHTLGKDLPTIWNYYSDHGSYRKQVPNKLTLNLSNTGWVHYPSNFPNKQPLLLPTKWLVPEFRTFRQVNKYDLFWKMGGQPGHPVTWSLQYIITSTNSLPKRYQVLSFIPLLWNHYIIITSLPKRKGSYFLHTLGKDVS